MSNGRPREGLRAARLLMVMSSFAPLFLLWALRGIKPIPDPYLIGACLAMVIIPYAFLGLRIRTAIKMKDRREIVVGSAEDHRDHLLVYLFAMLLPLYALEFSSWRDISAVLAALVFIAFLFWHLNLHYMNLLFAGFGYRVFTLSPAADNNPISGKENQVLITKRFSLLPGERVMAYRLSDTVYFEV